MKNFDENNPIENLTERHQKQLGMELTDGYFDKKKTSILEAVHHLKKEKKTNQFKLKYIYAIAASVALIISFFLWMNKSETTNLDAAALVSSIENSILINSLMIDDEELDSFLIDVEEQMIVQLMEEEIFIDQTIDWMLTDDENLDKQIDDAFLDEII